MLKSFYAKVGNNKNPRYIKYKLDHFEKDYNAIIGKDYYYIYYKASDELYGKRVSSLSKRIILISQSKTKQHVINGLKDTSGLSQVTNNSSVCISSAFLGTVSFEYLTQLDGIKNNDAAKLLIECGLEE